MRSFLSIPRGYYYKGVGSLLPSTAYYFFNRCCLAITCNWQHQKSSSCQSPSVKNKWQGQTSVAQSKNLAIILNSFYPISDPSANPVGSTYTPAWPHLTTSPTSTLVQVTSTSCSVLLQGLLTGLPAFILGPL